MSRITLEPSPSGRTSRLRGGLVAAALAASVLVPALPAAVATSAAACPVGPVVVPDLVDNSRGNAISQLSALCLVPSFSGGGNFVFRQSPAGGTTVNTGTTVGLTMRPTRG